MPAAPKLEMPGLDKVGAPKIDSGAAKKKRGRPAGKSTTTKSTPKTDSAPRMPKTSDVLAEGIGELYKLGAIPVGFLKGADAGEAWIENCDKVGEAWGPICDRNPKVRKFWQDLTSSGDMTKLAAAHAPLVLALVPDNAVASVVRRVVGGGAKKSAAPQQTQPTAAAAPPPPQYAPQQPAPYVPQAPAPAVPPQVFVDLDDVPASEDGGLAFNPAFG